MHRFQKFVFSVKTIRLHDDDIIVLSNVSTLETVVKNITVFSENDHRF